MRPNSRPTKQLSLFLSLAVELRLAIYQFAIDDFYRNDAELPLPPRRRHRYGTKVKKHSNAMHPLYPLLFVCRVFRDEVATVLYRSPALKFGSPHRCLFFLRWTSSHLHMLESLRITVPACDSFSLEPIFDLVLEERAPLQKLAIDFLAVELRTAMPPSDRLLPEDVGQEALRQARSRAMNLNAQFGRILHPDYRFFLRVIRTPVEIAQCSFTSTLGRIKTLRYIETLGKPKGVWAVEFELAILRLHARMFETAAAEGVMVVRHGLDERISVPRVREYIMVKETNWLGETWWEPARTHDGRNEANYLYDSDIWIGRQYGIEGTTMACREHEVPHMGRRYMDPTKSILMEALVAVKDNRFTPGISKLLGWGS